MTNEYAHGVLRLEWGLMSRKNPKADVLEFALLALEKQIPKAVDIRSRVHPTIDRNGAYVDADFEDWAACPCCGNRVGFWDDAWYMDSFCDNCGQALKEPEEEDL